MASTMHGAQARVRTRSVFRLGAPAVVAAWLAAGGCGGGDETAPAPAGGPDETPVRTADPAARGLGDADFPRVTELAGGVWAYEQLRSAGEERFTTVSLFVDTDEGVLVADGQGSVEETRRLLDTIAARTGRPVTHVVIGSDHGDHTGGHGAFPRDATVLVHPTSAAALGWTAEGAGDGGPRVELVEDYRVLRLGDREIHVLHLGRAHTGGDLFVLLPDERVLFLGEAFMNRVFPAMRAAFPTEWVRTLERARDLDVDVRVPGHGFVDEPRVLEEELDRYVEALEAVIAEGRRLHRLGLDVEAAVEAADFGPLETWLLRASQGPVAVRRVYAEVEGRLPAPPAR